MGPSPSPRILLALFLGTLCYVSSVPLTKEAEPISLPESGMSADVIPETLRKAFACLCLTFYSSAVIFKPPLSSRAGR